MQKQNLVTITEKRKSWAERNLPAFTGLAVASVAAAHAAIDVTPVTAALTDAGIAVATVGAAVLVVYVGVKAYKMVRGAL
jgi:hypothetical protein